MALIRDFEIPNNGGIVNNAYHMIIHMAIEERTEDLTPSSEQEDPIHWKAGRIGKITLEVYKDEDERRVVKIPVGGIGEERVIAMDPEIPLCIPENLELKFFIDTESSDCLRTQAYNYLKTTNYYKDAEEG